MKKINDFFVLQVIFFFKFVGTVFVGFFVVVVIFIIFSQVITELSIIFPTYLPFSQLYAAGFQM